jgi:hypothetical protein
VYGLERSLTTKPRKRRSSTSTSTRKAKTPVFDHGSCSVNHRTAAAAAKCRNR